MKVYIGGHGSCGCHNEEVFLKRIIILIVMIMLN